SSQAWPGISSSAGRALGDFELDTPIKRVTRVVRPAADEIFPEAHTGRAQTRSQLGGRRFQTLLDCQRALQREPVIEPLAASQTRVADHIQADLRAKRLTSDLPEPHAVGPADLRIRPEVRRPGIEQKLDAEALAPQTECDDLSKCFFGFFRVSELP